MNTCAMLEKNLANQEKMQRTLHTALDFLQVFVEPLCAEYFAYLHELILVAVPHEERLLLEDLGIGACTMEANIAPVDQISSE